MFHNFYFLKVFFGRLKVALAVLFGKEIVISTGMRVESKKYPENNSMVDVLIVPGMFGKPDVCFRAHFKELAGPKVMDMAPESFKNWVDWQWSHEYDIWLDAFGNRL